MYKSNAPYLCSISMVPNAICIIQFFHTFLIKVTKFNTHTYMEYHLDKYHNCVESTLQERELTYHNYYTVSMSLRESKQNCVQVKTSLIK